MHSSEEPIVSFWGKEESDTMRTMFEDRQFRIQSKLNKLGQNQKKRGEERENHNASNSILEFRNYIAVLDKKFCCRIC